MTDEGNPSPLEMLMSQLSPENKEWLQGQPKEKQQEIANKFASPGNAMADATNLEDSLLSPAAANKLVENVKNGAILG
ncbi:hypothetical protein [Streptomyces sp. CA-132043]|uniref:hypothetical protein n=1 Tax=Streptomyces sp. CA-132043 TaxID=3240048 RepID=UPI003D913461